MAESFGTKDRNGLLEGLSQHEHQKPSPDGGNDEPRSVIRLVHSAAVEVQPPDILERIASRDEYIGAVIKNMRRYRLDLAPLKQRITAETSDARIYQYFHEYVSLVARCLEVGPEVSVIGDLAMRKAAQEYAVQKVENSLFNFRNLRNDIGNKRRELFAHRKSG